jgi:hypothetical protein
MPPYRDSALRRIADTATIEMMDLWKAETIRVVGQPIEIIADNRRNSVRFRSFEGQLSTAMPEKYGGQLALRLWLEVFPNPDMLIIAHEIGHWVLKLQGFQNLACEPPHPRGPLLNDVASHVPLYALQRSVGHNPQPEIDLRTDHNIGLCSEGKGKSVDEKTSALLFADDRLNCSATKREQLIAALRENLPEVSKLVEVIVRTAEGYDLLNTQQSLSFRYKLVEVLELEGKWKAVDEVEALKRHLREV